MNLLDLPDELLLCIFGKLTRTEMLYSLIDVNERLDRLVFHPYYLRALDLTVLRCESRGTQQHLFNKRISQRIVPRIHQHVHELTLSDIILQQVLHTFEFPQLRSLSLQLDRCETFVRCLKVRMVPSDDPTVLYIVGDTVLHRLLRDQLECFQLNISERSTALVELKPCPFTFILRLATRLTDFALVHRPGCPFSITTSNLGQTERFSSTLTTLRIDVSTLDECLYLLDGRLECLSTLIVLVKRMFSSQENIEQPVLPKLKCFSLRSTGSALYYDSDILPLFRRMPNLEELTLYLLVARGDMPLIDGSVLSNDMLMHMPRLNKFTFNINTMVLKISGNYICASHDEVQRSFIAKIFSRVGSYADEKPHLRATQSHVYSLPYAFETCHIFSSSFRGGTFASVEHLFLIEQSAFEREFFASIAESFPSLRKLIVRNSSPQQEKQHSPATIAFPRLRILDLTCCHSDYAEQFLLKSRATVPYLAHLVISYDLLVKVTKHFTIDVDQLNYNQMTTLSMDEPRVRLPDFRMYCSLV